MERDDNIQYLPQLNEIVFRTILKQYPHKALEETIIRPALSFFHKIFYSVSVCTRTILSLYSID